MGRESRRTWAKRATRWRKATAAARVRLDRLFRRRIGLWMRAKEARS